MTKIEKAISWMEETARDNSHGYDQNYRWGEKGDYDCSAAVITAWEKAGVKVKKYGASYTGDIRDAFLKAGFSDVTKKVKLSTGSGLKRGDVLLREYHHVAMYCGNGKEVEASINEKGSITGGKPGDQTGREFLIRDYRSSYGWTHVLRYTGDNTVTEKSSDRDSDKLDYFDESKAGKYKVTAYWLNVRKIPGDMSESNIVGELQKGTTIECKGYYAVVDGKVWIRFTRKNKEVYASSKYLKKL